MNLFRKKLRHDAFHKAAVIEYYIIKKFLLYGSQFVYFNNLECNKGGFNIMERSERSRSPEVS